MDEAAETVSEVICSIVGQGDECVENIKDNVKIGLYVALVALILWIIYIMGNKGGPVIIQSRRQSTVPFARAQPVRPVIARPVARQVGPVIGKRVQ